MKIFDVKMHPDNGGKHYYENILCEKHLHDELQHYTTWRIVQQEHQDNSARCRQCAGKPKFIARGWEEKRYEDTES